MPINAFEDVAQSFLKAHSVGSSVSEHRLQTWAEQHGNGLAPDLAITDPRKRISAIRRHINAGARSEGSPEERRFRLDKDGEGFVVRGLADAAHDDAKKATARSFGGAIGPLKRARKGIESLNLGELDEMQRRAIEITSANIAALEKVVKPTYEQEFTRIWLAECERKGIPADMAQKLRQELPGLDPIRKLLAKASS